MMDMIQNIRGPILELVFNRPEKLNAMTREMVTRLGEAVDELDRNPDLRILLIRAKGRYFSAGSDIVEGEGIPGFGGSTMEARRWYRGGVDRVSLQSVCDKIEAVEKPVVIAHHAICLGGALEMSLSCDFRLAAKSARYGLPEIDLGGLPGSGGTSRITRIAGPHWARWMVMAGKHVDAERALTMGIVHDVYPDDEFDASVDAFCEHLLERPKEAMGLCKLAIELIADLDRAQGRNIERLANSILFGSPEMVGRFAAFRNRKGRGAPTGP